MTKELMQAVRAMTAEYEREVIVSMQQVVTAYEAKLGPVEPTPKGWKHNRRWGQAKQYGYIKRLLLDAGRWPVEAEATQQSGLSQ